MMSSILTKRLVNTFQKAVPFVLGLCGLALLIFLVWSPAHFMAAEDAVILWIYSKNLAFTGAITYVTSGPHAEGATDFAWMLAVAAAMRCKLAPSVFTAVMNVSALAVLSLVFARFAGSRWRLSSVLLVAGAAACMPQIFASASGFATLADAALLALTVYFCVREAAVYASITAFIFCLFRPDGIVFAVPLLGYLLFQRWNRERVGAVTACFVIPGLLYQIWRVLYFHEWFPLPFLVKSDAVRILGIFVWDSVRTSFPYLVFALVAIGATRYLTGEKFTGTSVAFSLLALPTCFYWFVRLDQNVGFRFFYFFPLAAAIIIAMNWPALQPKRSVLVASVLLAWLVLIAMPLRRELRTYLDLQAPDLRDIATDLRSMERGTLLSSEAGILPYYSEWPATDPWGLNTATFAHRFFQPGDVEEIRPSIIHIHPNIEDGCSPNSAWGTGYKVRSWQGLTRNIILGASRQHYDVWQTSYGSERYRERKHWSHGEGDITCWFVRKDTPQHDAVIAVLKRHMAIPSPDRLQ